MNKYTTSYAKSLLAATPQAQLVEAEKPKRVKGLSDEQIALMERESVNLEREFKIAEKSYGTDHLDLVLTNGYLGKLARQRTGRALSRAASPRHPGRIPEACRDGSSCGLNPSPTVRRFDGRRWGPGPDKRGDRRRRRTVGRIKRGGGDGGEPVRSPLSTPERKFSTPLGLAKFKESNRLCCGKSRIASWDRRLRCPY